MENIVLQNMVLNQINWDNFCQSNKIKQRLFPKIQTLILFRNPYHMATSSIYNSGNLDASKHTLNTSGSKQKFLFPKADRFSEGQNKSISDLFYNIPSTKSDRAPSFGYGQKTFGVTNDKNKPEPGTYTLPSQFESKKKGATFGQGRQKLQLGGPLKETILKKYIPGPGRYELSRMTIDVPTITIKGRLQDKSTQHLKKIPGPGTYEYDTIGSSKYYVSSRNVRRGSVRITPGQRLAPLSKSVTGKLGPGSYDCKASEINPEGKYFISSYEGSKSRQFSRSKRPALLNKYQLANPGPGSYSSFSSFS